MTKEQEAMKKKLGVSVKHKSFFSKRVIMIVSALALIALLIFLLRPKVEHIDYTTVDVIEDSMVVTVSTSGNIEPIEKVDVGSEVSGTLEKVYVDFDDKVKKGMVLAKIDTTKLDANYKSSLASLQQVYAALKEAEATLDESQKSYERSLDLQKRTQGKNPSAKEMDSVIANFERAKARKMSVQAQLAQARSTVETNKYNLERAVVVSPIDGIVLDRKVDAGQTLVAAMQIPILFTIANDLTKMKLLVSIDEADVGLVKAGQKASFTVDAYPDKDFDALITKVRLNANIVNSVVTYDAELEVNNPDLLLRPGMTASTEIVVYDVPKGLLVPNAALRFRPIDSNETQEEKAKHVWVLEEDQASKVEVQAGLSNGTLTSVKSDELHVGTKVIVKSEKAKQAH